MTQGRSRSLLVLLLLLSACQPEPVSQAPATAPMVVNVTGRLDRGGSDECRYRIRYPALAPEFATLDSALRTYAATCKRDFLNACAAAPPQSENAMGWELDLSFDVRSVTRDFVSILGEGSQFTGGAHGNPMLASFTYSRRGKRVLGLLDLFSDPPTALALLSSASRVALLAPAAAKAGGSAKIPVEQQHRIHDGTEPKVENFTTFLIEAGPGDKAQGLSLLFPTYQIAPYADGPQHVSLPAQAFVAQLKAEYRGAFVTPAAH